METNSNEIDSTICCAPGELLCKSSSNIKLGQGTYEEDGSVYASLAGFVANTIDKNGKRVLFVRGNTNTDRTIPQAGDIVTCVISSIQTNVAMCLIKCVNDNVLKQSYKAMIYKDVPDVTKICLPGDVVIGRVVGTGDNGRYLVSVVDKEFGVIIPTNETLVTRKMASLVV